MDTIPIIPKDSVNDPLNSGPNGEFENYTQNPIRVVGDPGVPENESNKFYDPKTQEDSTLP